MVSHASGARFVSLIGGSMLSFYDWYADLPVASPQVFGDQTDVPESGDWWDAGYLIMWGSNVPVTRTPDAHWMAEARYRGQKVIAVAPDYADNVKFADEWLAVGAGHRRGAGHGDGPRDPQGVLRRPARCRTSPTTSSSTPTCRSWCASSPTRDGAYRPGKFLTADGPDPRRRTSENADVQDRAAWTPRTGEPVVPNGSLGYRFGDDGAGRWNLDLGDVDPRAVAATTVVPEPVEVELPRFDAPDGGPPTTAAACRSGASAATWSPPSST